MAHKIKDEKIDFLFKAILSLQDDEECYNFFEDLCTVSELQEMSKRLFAAKLLSDNHIYNDIAEQTGLSTATISRVNRCLKYGNDGYLAILERMEKRK
ncbi:MAG: YerC/YecD family TrpR-related protein [Eubacteriales bacterium]